MQEEEARVKATWKEMDAAMWTAAFGEEHELSKYVANPAAWIADRSQCVIGFSDQIPVWVKLGRGKQVYCSRELQQRKTSADFKKLQVENVKKLAKEELKVLADKQELKKKEEQEEELKAVADKQEVKKEEKQQEEVEAAFLGTEDSTLTRTVGHAEQEKYRCTYERRAVIMKYFDPEAADPVALNWKPAIIVKGAVHCRLCNITDEGRTCVCTLHK